MNTIGKTQSEASDVYAMPELKEDFAAEVDLASRWLGGSVLAASDESFGEKESLLTPTPSAFVPGNYGPHGEIVDGWETKRRREPGHDWALIRLGAAGEGLVGAVVRLGRRASKGSRYAKADGKRVGGGRLSQARGLRARPAGMALRGGDRR